MLGRLMYLVRNDRRQFGWRLFLYELPMALGMGIVGKGVSDFFGFNPLGYMDDACMIVAGYLGPRVIDKLWENAERFFNKWLDKGNGA